jgi:hypothetical protein
MSATGATRRVASSGARQRPKEKTMGNAGKNGSECGWLVRKVGSGWWILDPSGARLTWDAKTASRFGTRRTAGMWAARLGGCRVEREA